MIQSSTTEPIPRELVSVIVPVYNSPRLLLKECLASIIAQRHPAIEIVLVDDGSDPVYAQWLDTLHEGDDRLRILHQQNGGVSEARNAGMRASRGEYICFVDSDDRVVPEFVSTAVDLLRRTGSDAAFGGILIPLGDRTTRWRYGAQDSQSPLVLERAALGPLRAGALWASPTATDQTDITVLTNVASAVYRRQSLQSLAFRSGVAHAEDRLFIVDFLALAERIALCSDVWYIYDHSTTSATRDLGLGTAQKLPATIRAIADAGGFPTDLHLTASTELHEAAATGILSYLKVLAGILADHVDRRAAGTLLREVLDDPGVRQALRFAPTRSFADTAFLAALRARQMGLAHLMARAWRLLARRRAPSAHPKPSRRGVWSARTSRRRRQVNACERQLTRPVVGLIVHFSTTNYGNHLVNYATKRILEKSGYQVELIDFHGQSRHHLTGLLQRLPGKLYRLGPRGFANRLVGRLGRSIRQVQHPETTPTENTSRHLRFTEFSDSYLRPRAVEVSARHELVGQFDQFAIGSGQIWNYDYGLGPWHFADFAAADQVVTLSPSVGHDEIPLEWRGFYTRQLARFSEIGVREIEWTKSLGAFADIPEISLLADPTLILTREEWANIAAPAPIARGKVLVYTLGDMLSEHDQYMTELCAHHGVEPLLLSSRDQGPQWETNAADFIGMVGESVAVVTDSYHGAIFAFLFDKPLIAIHRHGFVGAMNSRINTLLSRCHLSDRAIPRLDPKDALEHDYSRGFEALETLRNDFWSYMERRGYLPATEEDMVGRQ